MKPFALKFIPIFCIFALSQSSYSSESSLNARTVESTLGAVAGSQLRPLADGDYRDAESVGEMRKLKKPEGTNWSYPWGITLSGMMRASAALSDDRFESFVIKHNEITTRYYLWLKNMETKFRGTDEWGPFINNRRSTGLWRLMRLGNLDNCGTMGAAYLDRMMKENHRPTDGERRIINIIADWIIQKQPRLTDGTFWRPDETDVDRKWPVGTIWADDLYMACSFLTRYAQFSGERRHMDDAIRQIINMSALLQGSDGLWHHGYSVAKRQVSPVKWARANGWAMMATVDVLSSMSETHPHYEKLLQILRAHIRAIIKTQTPSGAWRQILDAPDSWEETSSTAIFVYSIARAVNKKWIDPEYRDHAMRAFEYIQRQIDDNGIIQGTCQGTALSLTADYYLNRKRPKGDYHGAGLVLLAGVELLQKLN